MKRFFLTALTVAAFSCQRENEVVDLPGSDKYLVSQTEAKTMAANFLATEDPNFKTNRNYFEVETVYDEDKMPASYLVHSNYDNKNAYVIVSADKRADESILGFGNNDFKLKAAPEQFKTYMEEYSQEISAMRNSKLDSPESIDRFNQRLKNNDFSNNTNRATPIQVGPYTSTTWGQGCVYNASMPKNGSLPSLQSCTELPCDRAKTGCVQTALAQTVNYYGSIGTINYNILKNNYDQNIDLGTKSGNEVAKLMKSIADIMGPIFSCQSTNTDSVNKLAKSEIKSKLGFTSSLSVAKFDNSDFGIRAKIMKELEGGNLVLFSGTDPNARVGHLWVVDGYKTNEKGVLYLSFNWGWNGTANGWYAYRSTFAGKTRNFTSDLYYYSGFRKK